MKITRFLSVAAFAAIAFTFFACSSDDPDDNTGSAGGVVASTNANGDQTYKVEGEQVYILGLPSRPYADNATLVGINCNSGGTVGRIENGKLFLDLPSIDLDPSTFENEDGIDGVCEEEFAVEGTNLYAELIGTTKGLTQVTAKDDMKAGAFFMYALESGEISAPDGTKVNLKKGWNLIYVLMADKKATLVKPSGLTWEWALND